MKFLLYKLSDIILSVPVRIKIFGIVLLPVLILGVSLNYWVQSGLSDWLSYLLSDERVRVAMQAGGRSVLFVTILAAIGAILLAFLLLVELTRPLLELRDTALQVTQGDLNSRSKVYSEDEIGEVAQSVNKMIDHLVAVYEDLSRSNRRLEAMNRIAMAANLEQEIHDILYQIIQIILDVFGMESGWIYLHDPDREQFHLASWHGIPETIQAALLHKPGDSLCACQQALSGPTLGGEAVIQPCQRLRDNPKLDIEEAHLSVRLEAREQQFGVINLLCDPSRKLKAEDFELLATLGSQISEIVANAWLQLKLSEKELSRQALLAALVEAQEDERSRIAHELHDEAGQMLTSLLVRLKTLEKRTNQEELKTTIADLCDTTSETIEYLRELSHRLRPVVLEEFGLQVALQMMTEEVSQHFGIEIDFTSEMNDRILSQEIETVIYRVAQESLTNVIRHAQAQTVCVELSVGEASARLQVEDDGRGFDPEHVDINDGRQRLGLLGMRERVEVLGGSFEVYSTPGQGTTVQLEVPLYELSTT
jgi:signal transduction histidine kinase